MSAHTPGPWTLRTPEHFAVRHHYQVMFQHPTCGEMSLHPEPVTMTDADARLIAAAPELLAALAAIVKEIGPQFGINDDDTGTLHTVARIARAAIAKATGES